MELVVLSKKLSKNHIKKREIQPQIPRKKIFLVEVIYGVVSVFKNYFSEAVGCWKLCGDTIPFCNMNYTEKCLEKNTAILRNLLTTTFMGLPQ